MSDVRGVDANAPALTAEPAYRFLTGTPLAEAAAGLDTCVHCGFCLQACPTYLALEDENDSPRGRIVLMRSMLEGTLAPTDAPIQTHISRCLGCRACETACPSGVPYGHLLEATRATMAQSQAQPAIARLVLAVFARPWLMKLAMIGARIARGAGVAALLSRLPGRIGFAMAMLHSTRPVASQVRAAPRASSTRGRAAVLQGCVMDGLFSHVNDATERVTGASGFSVVEAPGQRCCGALHAHSGDLEGARALARINIEAFERSGAETIVVNSAGCGAMMKEYGHLLGGDAEWRERAARVGAKVRDVSEIVPAVPAATAAQVPGTDAIRATYSPPCHLLHAQRVVDPPLRMLGTIPGLRLIPLPDADQCCGAAGIYNLVEPETSALVLEAKLDRIASTGAEFVLTGNPGCLMQIGAGLLKRGSATRAVHPVMLLDASLGSSATRHPASPTSTERH